MGTRANTLIIDTANSDHPFVNLYRQMDGYPECHGKALSEFLNTVRLVNGICDTPYAGRKANGAGCFAAQLVAHFKDGVGQFYLENPRITPDNDYTYTIRLDTMQPGKGFDIQVHEFDVEIFRGTAFQYAVWLAEYCKVAA